MRIILREASDYVLEFDAGEEVIGTLRGFCEKEKITSGFFSAIGASKELVLSYYSLEAKNYEDYPIRELPLEIVSLIGNVALLNNIVIVHAHGSFSDIALSVEAGHVKRLIVSTTCEMHFKAFHDKTQRKYDDATGLNLMR